MLRFICKMDKPSCIRLLADQQQITTCRSMIEESADAFAQLAKVLELSGNEVRLKILYLLDEEKELCPCDLSDILGMSIPAVSQHLRKLKDAGLIETRREAQTIFYSLTAAHIKVLRPFFKYIHQTTSVHP